MNSIYQGTHVLSFNVCQRCKHRKKKCDRALPGCARCTRLRLPCNYNSSQVHGLSTPPEPVDNAVTIHPGYDRNFFPEIVNPLTFITPQSVFLIPSREHRVANLDEQLTEQCWSIISRDGAEDGILSSCSAYFSSVHNWLPIISKEKLLDQILVQRSMPKGEVAVLALTIHLVSQLHQPIHSGRTSLDQLYHTTKGLHSFLVSTGRSNIELVQAGVLLAFFEHSQAFHDSTYQTLGACARMGYLLGFDKTLSPDFIPEPEIESISARQRQIWWGIIILERKRISVLEYLDKKLPFAIPKLSPSDILPSEDGTRQAVFLGLKRDGHAPDPGAELSIYARIAQGAYLLGHVIDRVRASNPDSSSCGAAYVDNTLRLYAMDLLQPTGHGHLCWPYGICLR
ncbi:hypothetical protein BKA65DRAFT_471996 [Rhexocercosporidium sp. MPI-PUGE-AT-0058]|nr:hypothetical protein BKA65DRAFT_471996 [Rhexocercosporidium sp. MPI-PUGE-AT-0058]